MCSNEDISCIPFIDDVSVSSWYTYILNGFAIILTNKKILSIVRWRKTLKWLVSILHNLEQIPFKNDSIHMSMIILVDIYWNMDDLLCIQWTKCSINIFTSLYFISGSWINYICKMLSIAKLNNYANPLTFEAKIFLKVDKPIAHK